VITIISLWSLSGKRTNSVPVRQMVIEGCVTSRCRCLPIDYWSEHTTRSITIRPTCTGSRGVTKVAVLLMGEAKGENRKEVTIMGGGAACARHCHQSCQVEDYTFERGEKRF